MSEDFNVADILKDTFENLKKQETPITFVDSCSAEVVDKLVNAANGVLSKADFKPSDAATVQLLSQAYYNFKVGASKC